jgi:hypothetical protein
LSATLFTVFCSVSVVLLLLYLLLFWSCDSLVGVFLGWFFRLLLVDVGQFLFSGLTGLSFSLCAFCFKCIGSVVVLVFVGLLL